MGQPRSFAKEHLQASDHQLTFILNEGLEAFEPTRLDSAKPLASRRLLALFLDEGSPQHVMCTGMLHKAKLGMVAIREISRRARDDC